MDSFFHNDKVSVKSGQLHDVIQYSLKHPGQTLAQTSEQFGLGHSTLAKWLSTYKLGNGTNSRSALTAGQQRIRQLEREVAHLREVNDIIKKAHV